MRILGLVTEYNPFHNGHLHHLRQSRLAAGADLTVAVMSGHVLQRGLPALTDKWTRAEMAVRCGVDLVVELPALYACSSAEGFAAGSVSLLGALGAGALCFGSEEGQLEPLRQAAAILAAEPPAFQEALRRHLDRGISFPEARDLALTEAAGGPLLQGGLPNNILGIEYCRAIATQGLAMEPLTIPRIGAGYHSTEITGAICSATAIRRLVTEASAPPDFAAVMPPAAAPLMAAAWARGAVSHEDRWLPLLRYRLLTTPEEEAMSLSDCDPGLWHRLRAAAEGAETYRDLTARAKTRRYTLTRIQRVLAALLLNIDAEARSRLGLPRYARVLGSSPAGRSYLRNLSKHCPVPLINNLARFTDRDPLLREMLAFDLLATDLFGMTLKNSALGRFGQDYRVPGPYIGS